MEDEGVDERKSGSVGSLGGDEALRLRLYEVKKSNRCRWMHEQYILTPLKTPLEPPILVGLCRRSRKSLNCGE